MESIIIVLPINSFLVI